MSSYDIFILYNNICTNNLCLINVLSKVWHTLSCNNNLIYRAADIYILLSVYIYTHIYIYIYIYLYIQYHTILFIFKKKMSLTFWIRNLTYNKRICGVWQISFCYSCNGIFALKHKYSCSVSINPNHIGGWGEVKSCTISACVFTIISLL